MARLNDDVTSVSIHEYGVSLDDRKSKVQCKFCDKVVSGFYRLKFHIGGVRGDVAPCDAAPLNVREQFRRQVLEAKGKILAQESEHPRNDQSAAAVNAWTGGLLVEREGESQTSVSNEVAEYFLETGINGKLSDPPRFQGMFGGTNSDELEFEIRKSHMHIFWAVSASDCMGLMLEKIAAVNDIRRVLDEATGLVRFVHNNAAVLKMFRDFTGSERENLIKPSKMRSAIPFLILESILSYKDELKEMFTSLEWKSCFWSKKVEGQEAAGLVKSSSFWKRAGMASKATTALIRVVDKIDLWWSVYGNRCPELQKLAIRILSQTCDGSGRYSLDRSVAEKLVCKEQNQHEQHRLRDQMFVRYNLQLVGANRKKRNAGGDIDSGGPSGSQSNKRRRPG
ncbi:hypothetical protein D5086_018823 [Populus alba]|uniref:Uncharacterized protein n=1 Tax=Populus alba TaxID=43335 RepID=A0ACC4BQU9_POPAL